MLMFARGDLEEGYQHPFQVSRAGRMRMRTKPHKSSLVVGDIYAMPEGEGEKSQAKFICHSRQLRSCSPAARNIGA